MKKLLAKGKALLTQHKRKFALGLAILCMGCMFALPASAAEAVTVDPVEFSDFQAVLTNLQAQISVATVVAVIAAVVGAAIGLVFMWWGVRKLIRVIMGAFKKGKVSV